jgi:hypothetical protein
MRPALGDVAVRARGLQNHLYSRHALERLARSAGSGVLASALQGAGYWPAPSPRGVSLSAAEAIDSSIEYGFARRLVVLASWLGSRREIFAAVFEDEERRALRIRLRRLVSGGSRAGFDRPGAGLWALPRPLREQLERVEDLAGLLAALRRARSAYAQPIARALREQGEDLIALELALDRAFTSRARRGAARLGGRLLAWVADAIDLENAWGAVVGGVESFVEGGARLSRAQHAEIAGETSEDSRRRHLARVFRGTTLSVVFDDPLVPLPALEVRATAARIAAERRAARVDPIGAAPILEFVMRLRAERADLRRINWGIAQGLPSDTIVGGMVATQ